MARERQWGPAAFHNFPGGISRDAMGSHGIPRDPTCGISRYVAWDAAGSSLGNSPKSPTMWTFPVAALPVLLDKPCTMHQNNACMHIMASRKSVQLISNSSPNGRRKGFRVWCTHFFYLLRRARCARRPGKGAMALQSTGSHFGILLFFLHELIATMQSVVTGQAPITLERNYLRRKAK